MTRRRLDVELVRRGLAETTDEALQLISSGRVLVAGRPALGHSRLVAPGEPLAVRDASPRYASRGGLKLDGALGRLGVDPSGRRCLDAGAGTGGFTDVLLARGAAHIVAVDVAYGGLAWRLRRDPRVTVLERVNVRSLTAEQLPYAPDLVVADLSFIALRTVVPTLVGVSAPDADLVLLVKPQFEAPASDVPEGGVVRDPGVWRRAVEDVAAATGEAAAGVVAVVPSPVPGPAGNVEFFVHARVGVQTVPLDLDATVEEARRLV